MFIQEKNFKFKKILDEDFFAKYKKGNFFVLTLDFDGVFTNNHQAKADGLNRKGYNLKPGETSRKHCLEVVGMPLEDYLEGSLYSYIEMLPQVPLEKDVKSIFSKLRKLPSIKIFIVTSRYEKDEGSKRNSIPAVEAYLKQHGLTIDGLFNTAYGSKEEILARLGANVLVEDTPSKLYEVFKDPKTCQQLDPRLEHCTFFLFRNAGNIEEKKARGKSKLLEGWKDLLQYVKEKIH